MVRRSVEVVVLAGFLASAEGAAAQSTVSKEALAETLFREASALIRAGNYDEACPKLEASQQADPTGGTVLLLAICYEAVGKTASAWLRFNEALAVARTDRRQDREDRARERLADLEPRLSFITIEVGAPDLRLPEFQLEVDGVALQGGGWAPIHPARPRQASRPGFRGGETGLVAAGRHHRGGSGDDHHGPAAR
ncbi:MAG: tetratricopeptide repeat protein [Polyangiaceae bacterium]|nr:tetratricopeptide repeat protein [Polyangiaceae bacterium]